MRVFALSDVHVDYRENMDHLEALSPREFLADALILAGDVTDDLGKLAEVLAGREASLRGSFSCLGITSSGCVKVNPATRYKSFRGLSLCAGRSASGLNQRK